jgi:hypothetical protein
MSIESVSSQSIKTALQGGDFCSSCSIANGQEVHCSSSPCATSLLSLLRNFELCEAFQQLSDVHACV